MKSVFGWLVDPYVLVVLIGLLMVWLSIRGGTPEAGEGVEAASVCAVCRHSHTAGVDCEHVGTGAVVVFQAE
jgi:hypothetical protein